MQYKTLSFKADESGKISGYFSTYDEEPDSYGDIVAPGAFTETIKARKESGHPFPLCFNHDFNQVIGTIDEIEDTEKGPHFIATFLDTPKAQEVREIVKSGAVYQFSFAYDVAGWLEPSSEQKQKGIKCILTKLNVYEVSVVVVPANQHAVITDVKAGARNSKKDADAIKQAIALLNGVLGNIEPAEGEDVKEPNGAPEEEPKSVKPEAEKLLNLIKNMEE